MMAKHPDESTHDVLVAGGGTAGVVAAVQAARLGARVLLVEKGGMLGGTMTVAGVAFPGLFHAWGRQVIAGIGWELVETCARECGLALPDFTVSTTEHWRQQVRLNGPLYAALCDEAVARAGAGLLLHAMPAAAERDGALWHVTLATKSGLRRVSARTLVDATGDANLAALAGAELRVPDELQPGTLLCRAAGYDPAALDMAALKARFREALEGGELSAADAGWNTLAPELRWLRTRGENANHISASDVHSSEGRTRLETDARASLLRLFRFLRRQPGLEKLRIDWLAAECGVRESVTVTGEATVTHADYVSGRQWDDAVCHSFYPIDLHLSGGSGLHCVALPEGIVPTVPFGALVPRGVEALLIAGRCISSDRLANSALRVQATCMATGQAAGAAAALAGRAGVAVGRVPLERLRDALLEHGAILPGCRAAPGR